MSDFNYIKAQHGKLAKKLSIDKSVDQSEVDSLISLIQNGVFSDPSERLFLRTILLFWNSSVKLSPIPEKESYEQESDPDTLLKRQQAKLSDVKPTFFDLISRRK